MRSRRRSAESRHSIYKSRYKIRISKCGNYKKNEERYHLPFTLLVKEADAEGITLTVRRKVLAEGAKRPKLTDVDERYRHDELLSVSYAIAFK